MRNLKIRYRKSFFGMFWTVLVPAGTALIYFAIFHFVLKVRMENYLLYILTGLIPWSFFSTTLAISLEIIVNNHGLLNKVPLPAHALVLAEGSTNILNFLLSLPVLLAVMILTGAAFTPALVQLVPLTGLLFLATYAIALLLSVLFVFFRDLRYLTGLVLQFWFYLTPIMYSPDMIPEQYRSWARLNPVFDLFDGFHKAVVTGEWISLESWGYMGGWTIIALILSFTLISSQRSRLVEIL